MSNRVTGAADGHRQQMAGERLTTPRAAAVAGIVFAALLIATYVLLRSSVPEDPADSGEWLDSNAGRVQFALWMVPFAGIAFLWFIGVMRDRLADREDQFFSSVLFGSGLLFIVTTFVATALAGALIATYQSYPEATLENGIYTLQRETIFRITNVFGLRMAGVFMFSSGTIGLRSGTMPRWMVIVTYAGAVVQLVAVGFSLWFTLLFPMWVLLVSVYFLTSPPRTPGVSAVSGAPSPTSS